MGMFNKAVNTAGAASKRKFGQGDLSMIAAAGGGAEGYRNDNSSFLRGATAGVIGVNGAGITIDAIANFSKLESKMSRVKWGLGGLAAVGAAYSIFGKD